MPKHKPRTYEICVEEGSIRKVSPDMNKAKSLLHLVEKRREFWDKVKDIAADYPPIVVEAHFEMFKELFFTISSLDGYSIENQECLFLHVEKYYKELELDFGLLNELRKMRNNIDYQGMWVNPDVWNKNKLNINLMLDHLIKIVKEKF